MRAAPLVLLLLVLAAPAFAVQPDEVLKDPVLEARARAISAGLRCLVCQNQSIDDSDAPLARDLRLIVRERLSAGDSDAAVRDYVAARYGDFVLLKPPFGPATLLLWLTPLLVLAGAAAFIWRKTRQGTIAAAEVAPLGTEERARLDRLLEKDRA
jgi:cytochrome c-type biogenesis protein CcmH